MSLLIYVCMWVSLKKYIIVALLKKNNQLAKTLSNNLFNFKKFLRLAVSTGQFNKIDKTINAEGGINNHVYSDRCSVNMSIFIPLKQNWHERFDYDVMRELNFWVNSLKRLKKLFRLPGFSCFINTTAEVSESRKAGMHQRPLSGATFVLIKLKRC